MISGAVYRTIPEQIVEHLRRDILSGALAEDAPLREKELSERFGVSRGPVRHALLQLTKEGLVVATPNVGVRVASHPSDAVLALVIELRRRIEVFALEAFFASHTEKDIETLETITGRLKEACERDDIAAVQELDLRFHATVVGRYGDKHLLDLWQSVVSRMMMRYTRFTELVESYKEHLAIFEAIRDGSKRHAVKLLQDNIQ